MIAPDIGVVVDPGPAVLVTIEPQANIEVEVISGVAVPTGGGSSPVTYHVTAVSSWVHSHSYPYYPDVRLVDSSGDRADIGYHYPDATHVAISFPTPFTGIIILS